MDQEADLQPVHMIRAFRHTTKMSEAEFMQHATIYEGSLSRLSDRYLKNVERRTRRPIWEFALAAAKVMRAAYPQKSVEEIAALIMNEGPKPAKKRETDEKRKKRAA